MLERRGLATALGCGCMCAIGTYSVVIEYSLFFVDVLYFG